MVLLNRLLEGLRGRGLEVRELKKPKIREMYSFEVLYEGEHLAYILVFTGRYPYYRGWIEVYGVNWEKAKANKLDQALVEEASRSLEEDETLFLEYIGEEETMKALERGVEPEKTRLGKLLVEHGFRSIEDMYFPEGFREGGPKLRAHKIGSARSSL